MSKHKNLFDNDSDEEDDLKINEDYASRYDRWRSKEEYEKLKARNPSDSSSNESSDEEPGNKNYVKADNPEFDRDFLLTLGAIYKRKKGDADVPNVKYFEGDYRLEKEKKEKPMTLKYFEQHIMVDREGKYEEDEADMKNTDSELLATNCKKIKFDDGLHDDDSDGDDLLASGLFKVKDEGEKEQANDEKEEDGRDEAVNFVKGLTPTVSDSKHEAILNTVKDKWKKENLSKKEKFLVDFFLNKRYLAEGSDDEGNYDDAIFDEEELSDEEEEEEGTSESNPLATQYKFRHQEPGELIKRHPRSMPESMRHKDERRKEKRVVTKQQKLMKKEEKRKEIEMLKAFKYKEIEEKIDKIKEASGNEDIDLGEVDLNADFDPSAHDAYMERMLGENYYDSTNAEEVVPEFEEEDETKVYDSWTRGTAANEEQEEEEKGYDEYQEEIYEEDHMDEGEVEQRPAKSSTRRKGKGRQSKFCRALEKQKPLFDPNERDFAAYFDEYYKLDFEDVVGGMPCRFKYRKVEANSFGLTTGEILQAQNNDLNRWVGMKKIMQHNRSHELEMLERQRYDDRAKHFHIKQKVLPSLFDENPEALAEREQEKRRLRNLKRKQKKLKLIKGITDEAENLSVSEDRMENNYPGDKLSNSDNDKQPTEETQVSLKVDDAVLEKKKKRKHCDIQETEDLESVPVAEDKQPTEETRVSLKVDESVLEKKKKKKKKKHCDIQEMGDLESVPAADYSKEKKKKKKKQKHTEQTEATQNTTTFESPVKTTKINDEVVEESCIKQSRKQKKKKQKNKIQTLNNHNATAKKGRERKMKDKERYKIRKMNPYFKGVSDARLEAYGQNPKKIKNRVTYGNDL